MTSSATSAKATTSARRITGGCSPLLSGSGVPTFLWEARVHWEGHATGSPPLWTEPGTEAGRRATAGSSATTRSARQSSIGERTSLTRAQSIDRARCVALGRTELREPRSRLLCRASFDAHRTGQIMAQTSACDRGPSQRAINALVFAAALLLASAVFSSTASAQVLGYASTPQSALSARQHHAGAGDPR